MKILFFDDNPNRHRIFKQNTIGAIVHHAYNISEAKQCLIDNTYDWIFLDHDMGEFFEPLGSLTGTGMEVVEFLIEKSCEGLHRNSNIIVHSYNRVCGADMVRRLDDAGFTVNYDKGAFERTFYINGNLVIIGSFQIDEDA